MALAPVLQRRAIEERPSAPVRRGGQQRLCRPVPAPESIFQDRKITRLVPKIGVIAADGGIFGDSYDVDLRAPAHRVMHEVSALAEPQIDVRRGEFLRQLLR